MNHEDFCNWLKGYLELANPAEIRAREIEVIREHLKLPLNKKNNVEVLKSLQEYNERYPDNPAYC